MSATYRQMPFVHCLLAACLLLAGPARAAADLSPATAALGALAHIYIEATAQFDPLGASALGLSAHDAELSPPSEAARAARIGQLRAWQRQLAALAQRQSAHLTLPERHDIRLLQAQFASELNEFQVRQTDRKNFAAPGLRLVDALFSQFLHLPVPGRDGATETDRDRAWVALITRLELGPAFVRAGQRMATRPGRLFGEVGSRQLAGAPDFLQGALSDAAHEQLAGQPALSRRFDAARDALLAELARTRATLDAQSPRWPQNHVIGRAAYDQMLRDELLLPFRADDVERMGRVALAHGWAEEAWLRDLARQRVQSFGASTGGGMAPSGPALVDYYRERIADLRAFVLQQSVVTLPDWLGSMQIVETPAFLQPVSPGASMMSPRLFDRNENGYYFITPPRSLDEAAARLDMNEDFDRDRILATAAHEAMPGHFLQLSIARRHPDPVRRMQNSAVFQEGWAYYGEEMFVRLGLYGDDLDARLATARWERVRGARALVDAKLASGEWDVPQAVKFFAEQTSFTPEAAEAAVSGIALNPGDVISYTVGRMQLQSLLGEYLQRTGDRGSLHDFHDRLLSYGSVPFSIVGPELLADLDKSAEAVRAAAHY